MKKLIIKIQIVSLLVSFCGSYYSSAAEGDDFRAAFSNLKATMGDKAKAESNAALDSALEAEFMPVPEVLEHSSVPLSQIDGPQTTQALKVLAQIPINSELNIEYESAGTAVSMTLWHGSQEALKQLFGNVVKQLYSDNDKRNFRLVVNSSPIPRITPREVDFNDARRRTEQILANREFNDFMAKASKEEKANPLAPKTARIVNVPPDMGVEIEMSAGMLATLKNVDEFAGQIAKALAVFNRPVYGLPDDIRFLKIKEVNDAIAEIIEQSDENVKQELSVKKEDVLAELNAMERLTAGGFNPWALYKYEERVYSWMADVFMKSKNYTLGYSMLKSGMYKIDDWTRPIRMQLQAKYMFHLQTNKIGVGMKKDFTEFSPRMKWIRLRMNLFVKPFYTGMAFQALSVALAGGAVLSYVFFPEIAHWVLSAVNATTTDFPKAIEAATKVAETAQATATAVEPNAAPTAVQEAAKEPTMVGQLIEKAQAVTQAVLDSPYLTFDLTPAQEALGSAKDFAVESFSKYYMEVLLTGSSLIAASIMAKYADSIGSFFTALAKNLNPQVPDQVPEIGLTEDDLKDPSRVEKIVDQVAQASAEQSERISNTIAKANQMIDQKKEDVELVLGSTRRVSRSSWQLGKRLAQFMTSVPNSTVAFYERSSARAGAAKNIMGQIMMGVGRILGETAAASKDGVVATAQAAARGTVNKAQATKNEVIERAEIAGTRLLRGWEAFDRAALATPPLVARGAVASFRFSYQMGKGALFGLGRGAKNFGIAGAQKAKAGGIVAGSAAMRGWEIFNSIAEATPDATVRGARAAGRMMLVVGGGMAWGIGKGSQLIFVAFPKGTYKMGARAIGASIAGTKQAFINARDKRRAKKDAKTTKENRIKAGEERLENFYQNKELRPHEIYAAMSEHNRILFNSASDANQEYYKETWGLATLGRFAKPIDIIIRDFSKWVVHAKLMGTNESELIEVMRFMNEVYKSMTPGNRRDKTFQEACREFYLLFRANQSEFVQGWLKAAETKRDPILLLDMITTDRSLNAKVSKTGVDIKQTITTSGDNLRHWTISEVYKKNEAEIVKWLASPETTPEEFSEFFKSITQYFKNTYFNGPSRSRFEKAVDELTPLERSRLLIYANMQFKGATGHMEDVSHFGFAINKGTRKTLDQAFSQTVARWVNSSKSFSELAAKVDADTSAMKIDPNQFRFYLNEKMKENPNLITSYADVVKVLEKEYFWTSANGDIPHSALEEPLMELLRIKREQFGDSPAWKYDPKSSESIHSAMKKRMEEIKIFPQDFEGLQKTWEIFTSRGVSTITDDILGQLLKMGTSEQINKLEDYAVRQGRVFDQGLRDEFAIRQLTRSEAYQNLMKIKHQNKDNRKKEIEDVIKVAQELMSDLGIRYVNFLEDMSLDILSTNEEAEMIEAAKSKRLLQSVRGAQGEARDSRLKMIRAILPYIKTWKPQQQYDFLLYLRGSKEATDFIKSQFPAFGPERIRKIFQGLPVESAMFVVDLYLAETLLARKEVSEGYGKRLMNFLVGYGKDAKAEEAKNQKNNPVQMTEEEKERAAKVKEYSALLLDGLLYGIDQAGDKPFQRRVLSALIAMKPNESNSVGETLKMILEQFPGVGPKIGQFLVGTGRLPPDINRVLIKTQDQTLPPNRHAAYSDLERIVKRGKDIGVELLEDLGQGSIKYTMKGVENRTKLPVAIQVFREDVQNSADLQIKILNHMIARLIKTGGKDWAFLQVVVDGAMNAVAREKVYRREAVKTALARRLYSKMSDENFSVAVPEQYMLNDRLLMSMFADGGSFHKMTSADQQAVGIKILTMESEVLFGGSGGVSWYDTDRHAGNFMVKSEMKNGKVHYTIAPIDFGQLTYIRHDQRDRVIELFALAGMLGNMGSNDWIAEKVASLFEIKGKNLEVFRKNLSEFFPVKERKGELSVVTDYFSLIAAINLSVKDAPKDSLSRDLKTGKLDFAYTDFVRGIIQLNQYEKVIRIPENVMTPRKILEQKTKDKLAIYLKEVNTSRKQEIGVRKVNLERWLVSKAKGEEFIPVKIRLTREELENLSIMPNDQIKEAEAAEKERKATAASQGTASQAGGVRCELMLKGAAGTKRASK